jgi:uncharacterized membrane protein YgdD (TMEM256/DUF423 family)
LRAGTCLILAGIAGLTGVAAGTFGAHLLEDLVSSDRVATFETGVRYHLFHAIALLAMTPLVERLGRLGTAAATCFAVGLAVFGGTLYALVLTGQTWLGAVTPIGGGLMLAGWTCLVVAGVRRGKL